MKTFFGFYSSFVARHRAWLLWLVAGGLLILCVAGLYASGRIIDSGQYFRNNPWLTVGVFIAFWFPALLIAEYILLLFVPLKWSVKKARALLLLFEMITALGIVIYMRFVWTAETLIGTPWIVAPQLDQLFIASCVAAIIARVIFFQSSGRGGNASAQDRSATVQTLELSPNSSESFHSRLVPSIAKQTQHFFLHTIIIVAILVFGWTQATHQLNGEDFDLQNDEFLQYGAAVGYLNTGEFVDWNFTKNEVQKDAAGNPVMYDRAWIGTWQIAQSMQLFGQNEFAARLPATLWFLAFLSIVYITAFVWTRSFVFAALAALSPIFFDGVMLHARMVRMYSPLLTLGAGIVISFWYLYASAIAGKVFRVIGFALLTAIFFSLGWLHHELILILAPGMIVFIGYEWVRYIVGIFARKSSGIAQSKQAFRAQIMRTVILVCICIAAAVLWGVNEYLNSAIFTLGHLGLRKELNIQYEFLVFMDFALPLTLMTLYLAGVLFALLHPRATLKERYLAVVSLTVIMILLIVVRRYKAYRYIQFLLPVAWGFVLLVWYRWVYGVFTVAQKADLFPQKIVRYIPIVAGISFFAIFVPISIAGVSAQHPWLTVAEADRTYEVDHGFDTQTAYNFIRTHKTAVEPVFTLSFRSVYWKNDPALPLVEILRQQTYTVPALQADLARYAGTPIWFVWEDAKDDEIPIETKRLILQNAQNLSGCSNELRLSGMHIFYWGDRRIPCDSPEAHRSAAWTDGHPIVTHALGNVGKDLKTNSKEALRATLDEGERVIEADFIITKDNQLVVKHDWQVKMGKDRPSVSRPQLYKDFMSSRVDGKYTPLDAGQLLQIIEKRPDVFLVVDAKGKEYATVLRLLQQEIEKINPALFRQIVLQTYHPEDVVAAKRFSDQSHILFTMYRTTLTDDEVIRFVQKEQISVVTVAVERFSIDLIARFNALGVRTYVHTINKTKQVQSLQKKGVYGVYSDTLTANDLSEKK